MRSLLRTLTWAAGPGQAGPVDISRTGHGPFLDLVVPLSIAADDMLGRRVEAAWEWRVRALLGLTAEPLRRSRFRRLSRNHRHPVRSPRQPGTAVVRTGMRQSWESRSNARA
jgi:hypothetical protein